MAAGSCFYPIPLNWYDFEDIIFHIYRCLNPGVTIFRYGRQGQKQFGIDILINDLNRTVIQCKDFSITEDDIDKTVDDIYITNNNKFGTNRIIIANTGKRDSKLQDYADTKNNVELIFWEDICSYIDFYQLGSFLFPTLNKPQKYYSKEIQSFFSKFTNIVKALGEQVPGYMFNIDLLCFIGDDFIPSINTPADLELAKHQDILNLISENLNKIIKMYTSEYYKSNGNFFIFDQSTKDTNILENNRALYYQLCQNICYDYERVKQLLL